MPQCCHSHRDQIWLTFLTVCIACAGADILVFSSISRHQIEAEFRDAPARFGGLIPSEGIQGMVTYADPPTACHAIASPPSNATFDGNWIVLISRYNCSFEVKIRMAQQAGFDAAIVHNVNDSELIPMSAKDPMGITIPSVFVSDISGLILKQNYLYNHMYFVLINDDLPFNINTHLLLPFAIVVGICFLVMVIFMVVRCIKDRRRQRRHRLPNSSLKKIPTHKYTKGDPYETCAICLDDYIEGEKLRVLPCAHAYHTKCIDPWLTKNRRVCPVCKRKVFAANERVVTDSESDSDADDSTPLIRDGHQGTQGGTFAPQRENPFTRSENLFSRSERPRRSHRRGSNASSNSGNSSTSIAGITDSSESSITESGSSRVGGTSSAGLFLISDTHSINGEPPILERSASSTKPHTVNMYSETDEFPAAIVHVEPLHNSWHSAISATSSEQLSSTTAPGPEEETNDPVA
ncbi:E3 ubiquitin-protein ligase RNF13-like [Venturia canescens]|uniref:E3 ubiquitin-protein ligase RNF13-like n=1 Tax=Venturia canescens TaxID=32260 RepID=UPI001C9BDD0A|nr:E3 ubiquitin-protein ligase RNF13-like [Venturia canescens]XP_043288090.1 E3 ubiquitin-protein ligase RNF13-like [Venturia canescens]